MEAALLHPSVDHQQSMSSPSKRSRNPKRSTQSRYFIPSRSNSGNFCLEMVNPFPLSSSLTRLNSSPYPLESHQPPLLPLPTAPPRHFRSLPTTGAGAGGGSRGSSLSPTHKKRNKGKDQTKSKPTPKRLGPDPDSKSDPCASTERLGPDPDSLPKDVTKVLFFPPAPPPSSLPMPKFSLMKPKLSCRVEAAGACGTGRVDTGATDNLCRLLNLR